MKKLFIVTICSCLLMLSAVSALSASFSPGSLIYNQNAGVTECKSVRFTSDGDISVINDVWSKAGNLVWETRQFTYTGIDNNLNVSYSSVMGGSGTVNVCITGTKSGEYHGALYISPSYEGNQAIRMGIWLKATIVGDIAPIVEIAQPSVPEIVTTPIVQATWQKPQSEWKKTISGVDLTNKYSVGQCVNGRTVQSLETYKTGIKTWTTMYWTKGC